ncbi:MAG: NADPH-dependent FMN reductase [Lachnospiraceae bacterium]
MSNKVIGVIVGSLRKDSFSKKIAKAIAALAPADLEFKFIDISSVQLYNQDLDDEAHTPQNWIDFRNEVRGLDGYLFVTPEYNRSVPAVMKNALDVGSRPYGSSVWDGKPAAVVSVSPGALSGFGANHHLRQSMVFLNLLTMQQPEAYIGNVESMLDADGNVTNERSVGFLKGIADAFAAWVRLHTAE